jgi:hypothetical protein
VELIHVLLLEQIVELVVMDPAHRRKSLNKLWHESMDKDVHINANELVVPHHQVLLVVVPNIKLPRESSWHSE